MSESEVHLTNLSDLSREELVSRVQQLEAHVHQLRNILAKQNTNRNEATPQKQPKKRREFDFKRYNKRHVALKVCYLGWDYQGLAVQEDAAATIERELFAALHTTRLIESRESSNYHRCGRTDKGVSAFGQVISIDLRTNLMDGPGVIMKNKCMAPQTKSVSGGEVIEEIRYVHILNNVLPPDIRILAWTPIVTDFSARFNCNRRMYKYYFPEGDLNIELMREAGQQFVGHHDFRNFCKMDVGNGVVNYERIIHTMDIKRLDTSGFSCPGSHMLELTVLGQAFLWHQIRYMVAVLVLVGRGLEKPDIISQLLDVEANPCKPQYCMAAEFPLVLFDSEYDDISWQYDNEALISVIKILQENWTKHAIRATMIQQMLQSLQHVPNSNFEDVKHQSQCLIQGCSSKVYKPLLCRPACESLEDRMLHYTKKRKHAQDRKRNSKEA